MKQTCSHNNHQCDVQRSTGGMSMATVSLATYARDEL